MSWIPRYSSTPSRNVLIASLLVVASLMLAACSSGDEQRVDGATIEGLPPEFQRLSEVWELLYNEQIDKADIDAKTISNGAIKGMLIALGDPYASFLNPDQMSLEQEDIKGFFGGIGAEVGVRNGAITILAPMPDTPAAEAGVRAGDVILEVDGNSIRGLTLLEVVNLIRGEKGTKVRLLLRHLSNAETILVEIERDIIELQSVSLIMQVGRIGHLRLSGFTGTTNDDLKEALHRFDRSKGLGIVLDLRNNPGGLVSSVVDVTSQFIDSGLVLYQEDARANRREWKVKPGGAARNIPMVVLVNQFSASASEVFTGAIMDHDRATVIGTKTFGKGSVTNMWQLRDGSGVNFTTARWFTPGGTLIEGQGLVPDVVLAPLDADADEDIHLDQAIQILKGELDMSASGSGRK